MGKCAWWQDLFGLCTAGEEIGEGIENAAVEVGKRVFATFNYWASLIEDYHAGTPAEQEKARKILQGVFKDLDLTATPNPFQLRLSVSGIDTSIHPFRVAILKDTAETVNTVSNTIRKGVRSDFNFFDLRGTVPAEPTDLAAYKKSYEKIKEEVAAKSTYLSEILLFPPRMRADCYLRREEWSGYYLAPTAGDIHKDCVREERTKLTNAFINLVMQLADDKIQLRTNQLSHSVPWNGQPFITIVVPEIDLKHQPNLKMYMVLHATGNIDDTLPEFQNNPYEISVSAMLASATMPSDVPDHGGKYKIRPVIIH